MHRLNSNGSTPPSEILLGLSEALPFADRYWKISGPYLSLRRDAKIACNDLRNSTSNHCHLLYRIDTRSPMQHLAQLYFSSLSFAFSYSEFGDLVRRFDIVVNLDYGLAMLDQGGIIAHVVKVFRLSNEHVFEPIPGDLRSFVVIKNKLGRDVLVPISSEFVAANELLNGKPRNRLIDVTKNLWV